jgi:hypothetical protein
VLPVVNGLLSPKVALQPSGLPIGLHHQQVLWVSTQIHHSLHPFPGYAVAVALVLDQRCRLHPNRLFHIPIKGLVARHQAARLILPNIGNAHIRPFRACQLLPGILAGTLEPLIELGQAAITPLSDHALAFAFRLQLRLVGGSAAQGAVVGGVERLLMQWKLRYQTSIKLSSTGRLASKGALQKSWSMACAQAKNSRKLLAQMAIANTKLRPK